MTDLPKLWDRKVIKAWKEDTRYGRNALLFSGSSSSPPLYDLISQMDEEGPGTSMLTKD